MSDGLPLTTRLVRKKPVRSYRGRGDVYSWLRAHHDQVEALRAKEGRAWSEVIADMVRDGVTGQDGQAPTIKSVSKVWQRVSHDVAAEAAFAKPKRKPPSRISPQWRPQVVAPASTAVAVATPRSGPETPEEVKARLRRQMANR